MTVKRASAALIILAMLGLGGFVMAARSGALAPDEATLVQRYALPESAFLDINGQRIHYAEQGSGAPIVLMHGSFGSLLDWDDWATALSPQYRIVRFDLPRLGLSGPNPAGSDSVEYRIDVLHALAAKLNLKRFLLVATSSGGEVAAAYAAQYPQTLSGLILSNVAVGPLNMDMSHLSLSQQVLLGFNSLLGGWRMRAFWQEIMRMNYAAPARVAPEAAARWTDLNNRTQGMPPVMRAPNAPRPFVRTPDDLAQITVPTLLLWSAQDAELPAETVGQKALQLLGSADKQLLVVPDCGHMMPLECGAESSLLAREFIARTAR